ncbi:NAD(P)-binding protein [Coniochaeta sp. PMI_546]|nr:NAD(P)-binding protein [Coniochaeta sp. PMI_546]
MAEPKTTIPKGSWVLVTGATGYVASQVAKYFLERGYKVRGSVRDLKKASWLVDDVFKSFADRGDFELVLVPDFAADHAFDDAVRGVSAIAHVASIVTFDPDPTKVIPQTVRGAVSILEAALREPSVREFVYTSSIVAATIPMPGNKTHVDRDTWNETAVQLAWSPPPYDASRGSIVYMASKTEAEKAVWKFVEEKQPHFTVNSVCPSSIMGEPLHKSHIESSASWLKLLYDGKTERLANFPASYNIDVKDVALLHVAAVLDPDVKNARLQAWAEPFNWNDVLVIMRRLYPDHKFVDDLPGMSELSLTTDFTQQLSLLKKWGGQDGWRTLEQTVEDNLRAIVAWEDKSRI